MAKKEYEISELKEDIAQDEKLFIDVENIRKRKIELKGKKRLKLDKYNPDGTKSDVFSFYDCLQGAHTRTKIFKEAIEKGSVENEQFNDSLQELRTSMTYSNLNIDFETLDRKLAQNTDMDFLKTKKWRKFNTSTS